MRCRGLTDASVKMGAALPPRRFQQQKESFKKYLLKTKELHFRYEGNHHNLADFFNSVLYAFAAHKKSCNSHNSHPYYLVQSMNSIRCRAEEIIKTELIYC